MPEFEQPPIRYSATEPQDEVAALLRQWQSGAGLPVGDERQVLRALLDALHVPSSSQVLVFSKTSLQRRAIRPDRPRALYFSDTVYVGWVPGGLIEVAAVDPELGPVFYVLDPRANAGPARTLVRDADCLRCHGGHFVRDAPAVFARSVVPDRTGEPLLQHGTLLVDDRTPFSERWGGWYVTGYAGKAGHRGNTWVKAPGDDAGFAIPMSSERPMDLTGRIDASSYLENTSDVVALLVMEHQMTVQNGLTLAGQRCRKMLAYQRALLEGFKQPATDDLVYDSVKSVVAGAVDDVVDLLLFRDAAPLPAGVVGTAEFREDFMRHAPRSRSGHALKDLRLRERLFEVRCSYLIYSATFAALPAQLKDRVLDRLHAVLTGTATDGRYAYLDAEEKRRIHAILSDTHAEAQARWARLEAAAASSPQP